MATGIPMISGGDQTQGPYPSYSQTPATYDPSEINAPGNPYSGRSTARGQIIGASGGRDPRAYNPSVRAAEDYNRLLPQLFNRVFQQQGYTWGNATITPQEYAMWTKAADNLQKLIQARATEEFKNLSTQQAQMERAYDSDRKQYNAQYWKTHPTEQDLMRERQNKVAASEKAYSQAQTATEKTLKQMSDPMTGQLMVPDEKNPGKERAANSMERVAIANKLHAGYYEKFADAYGLLSPEQKRQVQMRKQEEAFQQKVGGLQQAIAKNPDMKVAQLAGLIKQNFAGGPEQEKALAALSQMNPTLGKALIAAENMGKRDIAGTPLKDVAARIYDPKASQDTKIMALLPEDYYEKTTSGKIQKATTGVLDFLGVGKNAPEANASEYGGETAGIPGRASVSQAGALVDAILGGSSLPLGERSEAEKNAIYEMGLGGMGPGDESGSGKGIVDYLHDAGMAIRGLFQRENIPGAQPVYDEMTGTWVTPTQSAAFDVTGNRFGTSSYTPANEQQDVMNAMDVGPAAAMGGIPMMDSQPAGPGQGVDLWTPEMTAPRGGVPMPVPTQAPGYYSDTYGGSADETTFAAY